MVGTTRWGAILMVAAVVAGCGGRDAAPEPEATAPVSKALVGKLLFFDTNLSTPAGQSCASCHSPDEGFADPDRDTPVSRGVVPSRFGNRNAPSAAYASYSPPFHWDAEEETYVGGQFWDGRASTLVDQAKGPFLNPLEMNDADAADVVAKVRASEYAPLFERAFGEGALDDAGAAYDRIAQAIAEYEKTRELARFTSKYDFYLRGEATLTPAEQRGLALFEDEKKGNCAACHPSKPADDGSPPLFTDFTYDNLGIPKNGASPFLSLPAAMNPEGTGYVDRGLGEALDDPSQDGRFKVPSLRNVAITAPYGHNGYFATLRDVVDFYDTRDVDPKWAPPEVPDNVNHDELGDLGLTDAEVDDLVAFLGTLTDGWVP